MYIEKRDKEYITNRELMEVIYMKKAIFKLKIQD